ncbi:hypothetical protein BaRGS_00038617 [Batillaria attramentaria]|uniref:Uncharacterized protein n=1 Tax=Batillaria attramentaria TaxID=370345 RepID=A0ABD0J5M3_9CAEN
MDWAPTELGTNARTRHCNTWTGHHGLGIDTNAWPRHCDTWTGHRPNEALTHGLGTVHMDWAPCTGHYHMHRALTEQAMVQSCLIIISTYKTNNNNDIIMPAVVFTALTSISAYVRHHNTHGVLSLTSVLLMRVPFPFTEAYQVPGLH